MLACDDNFSSPATRVRMNDGCCVTAVDSENRILTVDNYSITARQWY